MSPLSCPRCDVALALVAHPDSGDRFVAACPTCAGVWLDANEASKLLAPFGTAGLRPAGVSGAVACPQCRVAMAVLVTPVAKIEIDRCPAHGVWFDRGEMAHVADLVSKMSGRALAPTPAPYREAPSDVSWGPGVFVAGAAVGTVAAAAASSSGSPRARDVIPEGIDGALDGAEVGHATIEVGAAVAENAGDLASAAADGAGEAVGAAAEVGGSVIEGAGEVLGSVFEALGGLFS